MIYLDIDLFKFHAYSYTYICIFIIVVHIRSCRYIYIYIYVHVHIHIYTGIPSQTYRVDTSYMYNISYNYPLSIIIISYYTIGVASKLEKPA